MIKGIHAMFYSDDPDATRAFLRDQLGLAWADIGHGWLIFRASEAEIGSHAAVPEKNAPAGTHMVSFYCDDVAKTVELLKSRGVEFTDGITDQGFGLITHFRIPGGIMAELYEPRYKPEYQT